MLILLIKFFVYLLIYISILSLVKFIVDINYLISLDVYCDLGLFMDEMLNKLILNICGFFIFIYLIIDL